MIPEGSKMETKRTLWLITLAVALVIYGCGSPVGGGGKFSYTGDGVAGGSSGGTPPPPSGGGSGSVVNSAGFFLSVTTSGINYTLHKASTAYGTDIAVDNFTTECKIPDGTTGAAADITCMLEIEELDLYFNSLSFQIHVPSDMCTYLFESPYDFFYMEPGVGPALVSYDVWEDGTIHNQISADSTGVALCPYDYSKDPSVQGPNCCEGTHTTLVRTETANGTPGDGPFTSSITTGVSWGGKGAYCLTGPAMHSQDKNAQGYPMRTITYIEGVGYNKLYTVPAAIDTAIANGNIQLTSNLWAANFFKPSEHATVIDATAALTGPLSLANPNTASGTGVSFTPQPTYSWACTNRAQEILARIQLLVREWNTHDITSGGDPDVFGNETTYPFEPLNDRWDWKDVEAGGPRYPSYSSM